MKPPRIDLGLATIGRYIQNVGLKRKLLRLWPKKLDGGVEVFDILRVYPDSYRQANKKLLTLLKVYEQFKPEDIDGVSSMWLKIDFDKYDGTPIADTVVANRVNIEFPLGVAKSYTLNITYDILNPTGGAVNEWYTGKTDAQIISYVMANYTDIYTTTLVQCSDNTIGEYTLLDGIATLNTVINSVTTATAKTNEQVLLGTTNSGESDYGYVPRFTGTISLDMATTRIGNVVTTSPIVLKILDVMDKLLKNSRAEAENEARLKAMMSENYDASEGIVPRIWNNSGIWYNGQLRTDALRAASVSNPIGLKSKLAVDVLVNSISSDYTKKSIPWWKAVILIVVIAVVSYYTAGGASASALTLMSAATIVSLVVGLVLSKTGDSAGASYANEWSAATGVMAQFLGVLSIAKAISSKLVEASMKQAAKQAVIDEAKQQGTEMLISEVTTEMINDKVKDVAREVTIDGIKEYVSSSASSVWSGIAEQPLKYLRQVTKFVIDNKLKTQQDELDSKRKELQEVEDKNTAENAVGDDLAQLFIATNYEQLRSMKGHYQIDWQYEPTTTNICRRTFA